MDDDPVGWLLLTAVGFLAGLLAGLSLPRGEAASPPRRKWSDSCATEAPVGYDQDFEDAAAWN